jgi:hypothetical protein
LNGKADRYVLEFGMAWTFAVSRIYLSYCSSHCLDDFDLFSERRKDVSVDDGMDPVGFPLGKLSQWAFSGSLSSFFSQ